MRAGVAGLAWLAAVGLAAVGLAAGCIAPVPSPEPRMPSPPSLVREGELIQPPEMDLEPPQLVRVKIPTFDFPGTARPACPDGNVPDEGEAFRPLAPAPHPVAYEGPYGCALLAGVNATVQGRSLSVRTGHWDPGLVVTGPVGFVADDGRPLAPGPLRVLRWDATGAYRLHTSEPHAVTPDGIDLPFADLRLHDRVAGQATGEPLATLVASAPLEGPATVHVGRELVNGTLTLAAGEHGLAGSARLTLAHDLYRAAGERAVVAWHDVEGLAVAGRSFSGQVGVQGTEVDVALLPRSDGSRAELRMQAVQAWRERVPLLLATLEVEEGPTSITVRETSGRASLEGVRVHVEGQPASNESRAIDEWTYTAFALSPFGIQFLMAMQSLAWGDPALVDQWVSVPPGGSVTVSFPPQQQDAAASVASLNGGSWTGIVPAAG